MNKDLGKLLNTFFRLCTECENWTTGTCSICEHMVCDDCSLYHMDLHADEDGPWDDEDET